MAAVAATMAKRAKNNMPRRKGTPADSRSKSGAASSKPAPNNT